MITFTPKAFCVILLILFCFLGTAKAQTIYYQTGFDNDETGSVPESWSSTTVVTDTVEGNNGKCIYPVPNLPATFISDSLVTSNVSVQFRIKAVTSESYIWKRIEIFDQSNSILLIRYHNKGGASRKDRTLRMDGHPNVYFNNNWNHVQLDLDLKNKKATLYINGKVWLDEISLPANINGFYKIDIGVPFDDFKLSKTEIKTKYFSELPFNTSAEKMKVFVLRYLQDEKELAEWTGDGNRANFYRNCIELLLEEEAVVGEFPDHVFKPIPDYGQNPYVLDMFHVFERNKNSRDVLSVEDYRLSDELIQTAYAAVHPQSIYRITETAVKRLMRLLDKAFNEFDQRSDFTNSFQLPFALLCLKVAFPKVIPQPLREVWNGKLSAHAKMIINDKSYAWKSKKNGWYNADIRYALGLYTIGLVFENEEYMSIALEGFDKKNGLFVNALLPDGGFNYVGNQNEVFTYHAINIESLSWFHNFTGRDDIADIIRSTKNYYPFSLRNNGVAEYYTAVAWKQYWNQSTGKEAAYVVASLSNCNLNYNRAIDAKGVLPAIYYNSSLSRVEEQDSILIFDRNIIGPRGIYPGFSYAVTARNVMEGIGLGKPTLTGCMVMDENSSASWPLNAALSMATSEVRSSLQDDQFSGRRLSSDFFIQNERSSIGMCNNISSLASSYKISTKIYVPQNIVLDDVHAGKWLGKQMWILSPTRLVGLLEIEAGDDDVKYGVHALFKFVSGRSGWGEKKEFIKLEENEYEYGNLQLSVHQTDYIETRSEIAPTWDGDNSGKSTYLILSDKQRLKENSKTEYYKNFKRFALVEIRQKSADKLIKCERISDSNPDIDGFAYETASHKYNIVYNTSPGTINYKLNVGPAKRICILNASFIHNENLEPQQEKKEVDEGSIQINEDIESNGHLLVQIEKDKATMVPGSKLIKLEMFPNPVNEFLFFLKKVEHVKIYNSTGCLIHETSNKGTIKRIDFRKLRKGLYIVKAFSDSRTTIQKIVKY